MCSRQILTTLIERGVSDIHASSKSKQKGSLEILFLNFTGILSSIFTGILINFHGDPRRSWSIFSGIFGDPLFDLHGDPWGSSCRLPLWSLWILSSIFTRILRTIFAGIFFLFIILLGIILWIEVWGNLLGQLVWIEDLCAFPPSIGKRSGASLRSSSWSPRCSGSRATWRWLWRRGCPRTQTWGTWTPPRPSGAWLSRT